MSCGSAQAEHAQIPDAPAQGRATPSAAFLRGQASMEDAPESGDDLQALRKVSDLCARVAKELQPYESFSPCLPTRQPEQGSATTGQPFAGVQIPSRCPEQQKQFPHHAPQRQQSPPWFSMYA